MPPVRSRPANGTFARGVAATVDENAPQPVQWLVSTNRLDLEDYGIRDTTLLDNSPVTESPHPNSVPLTVHKHWYSAMLSYDVGKGDVERLATIIGQIRRKRRNSRAFNDVRASHPCPHES